MGTLQPPRDLLAREQHGLGPWEGTRETSQRRAQGSCSRGRLLVALAPAPLWGHAKQSHGRAVLPAFLRGCPRLLPPGEAGALCG